MDERTRPVGRPLLALSDVHGDSDALERVLAELRGVELCGVVAAGDHCYGGPDPFGVWQRLQDLQATLVRGETDLALGTLEAERLPSGVAEVAVRAAGLPWPLRVASFTPESDEEKARLDTFLAAREALGEIVCRRLAELPTTAVVSLDGRAGVMVTHGSPSDSWRALTPEMREIELIHEVGCTAEDVLVTGRSHRAFARTAGDVLVVGPGSIGQSRDRARPGLRAATAALIQEFTDGRVRARTIRVEWEAPSSQGDTERQRRSTG